MQTLYNLGSQVSLNNTHKRKLTKMRKEAIISDGFQRLPTESDGATEYFTDLGECSK